MQQHPIKFFENHNLKARAQQIQVIEQIHQNWDKYKYFMLSLPTGVGKTYIATSIADSIDRAYILTSTLQLQTQYEKSWESLINLKGRSNYTCNLNSNFTVDAAPCTANPDIKRHCVKDSVCSYYNQKKAALNSHAMITNPVYMLVSSQDNGKDADDNPWVQREGLIVDEAHNMENHLVQFAETDVDPIKLHSDFGVNTNHIFFTGRVEEDYFKIVEIRELLEEKATELGLKLINEFPQQKLFDDNYRQWAKGFTDKVAEKVKKLTNKIYALTSALAPLKIFFDTHSTPDELASRWIISKYSDKNIIKLSPIYGDFLFKSCLEKMGKKFVFLSATLGSKEAFCRELGIPESETLFIETDSPFPPAKSPVIVMPSIKLSKDVYETNAKKVGGFVDIILETHPNQRGIIHAVTYDLATKIFQGVNKENRKRLLTRDMDTLNGVVDKFAKYPKRYKNPELLEIHEREVSRKLGTVLMSPSMMEGVDLADDLSEFQIIIKLPWGNLGDARIKHKSQADGEWYANKMWLNILQASGRSTRHEEDSSVTYILDENFDYFYRQWEHKLPNWFKNRLVF